jgi:hypothetical protein
VRSLQSREAASVASTNKAGRAQAQGPLTAKARKAKPQGNRSGKPAEQQQPCAVHIRHMAGLRCTFDTWPDSAAYLLQYCIPC